MVKVNRQVFCFPRDEGSESARAGSRSFAMIVNYLSDRRRRTQSTARCACAAAWIKSYFSRASASRWRRQSIYTSDVSQSQIRSPTYHSR